MLQWDLVLCSSKQLLFFITSIEKEDRGIASESQNDLHGGYDRHVDSFTLKSCNKMAFKTVIFVNATVSLVFKVVYAVNFSIQKLNKLG